jgi:hypothetical protein
VSWEQRVEKLRAEFEALDDTQKDYLVGIAKALAFARTPGKADGALSPPGPDGRETKREGQRR